MFYIGIIFQRVSTYINKEQTRKERIANMGYDYENLCRDGARLASAFGFLDMFSVGESVMERKILCFSLGNGERKLFINGAHHGLEYLTAAFIMKFLEDFAYFAKSGRQLLGYNLRSFLCNTTLFAIPMVNPDGVDIALHGLDLTAPRHRRLCSFVGIHNFGSVWQANANGVDINHNYDAAWRKVAPRPAPTRYCGPYAESEPETRAIVEFTKSVCPDILIAFHSQGREIYYDFNKKLAKSSLELARIFARESGYALAAPEEDASFGGCKDWFIDKFNRPGFTIEMGIGKNPLPLEMLDNIYEENAKIILCALDYLQN